jgi:predicted permease
MILPPTCTNRPTLPFWRWLIRFIGLIVPRRLRADWRQEWEAEFRYREALLSEWDRLDWRNKLDLLRRSLGAFWDALLLQPKRWEDEMFQDLRYGVRMLRTHRAVTLVAVLSLALGIGANTALFSVVDAVLLKKLPVKDPEQLVLFSWRSGPNRVMGGVSGFMRREDNGQFVSSSFSYLTYQQFRAQTNTLTEVFAFEPIQQLNVLAGEQAEIATGQLVSGGYYSGLGVQALLGRTITDAEDKAEAASVAVLSHRYWQRKFGGDPAIVGKTIHVNNAVYTIIGVTPPEFLGTLQVGESPDVTLPLASYAQIRPGDKDTWQQPRHWFLRVMGRIKPGLSYEQVRASLEGALQHAGRASWDSVPPESKANRPDKGPRDLPTLVVESGSRGLNELRRSYQQPLRVLWFVVGLVLLIACANVANLLLARAAVRQKELAVRLALGASRLRLIRQLLTESLLLSLLGGALGVWFGWWAKDFLLQWNPFGNTPPAIALKLDLRVLGFTLLVSLLTGIIFGLAPALQATRVNLNSTLKDEARGQSSGSRARLSQALIVAQVAMSVVLLIGAGLFVRTLHNLNNVDVGFNRENLLLFRLDPRLNNYRNEQMAPLYEQIIERLQAVPGVRSATLSRHPLLSGSFARMGVSVQGHAKLGGPGGNDVVAHVHIVRSNFFETMEMPLLLGRALSPQDNKNAPKAIVINQALARQLFKDDNPLGRRLDFENPAIGGGFEVVGVVADARYTKLNQDNPPTVYTPYLQQPVLLQMNFEVRTAGDPLPLIPAIREAVRQVDKNLPLFDVKTQSRQIEESVTRERAFARLTACFGLLALLLASIGLYGVMAYGVAQRTREIGIRLALGAQRSDVLRLVLKQGAVVTLTGVVIGIAAAIALSRSLASFLYEVKPTDALTYLAVALLLGGVALLACYLPARKATKVDPLLALRHE